MSEIVKRKKIVIKDEVKKKIVIKDEISVPEEKKLSATEIKRRNNVKEVLIREKKLEEEGFEMNERQKKHYKEIKEIVKEKGGEIISKYYINYKTNIVIRCRNNHVWSPRIDKIKNDNWCWHCHNISKKTTKEEFIRRAKEIHGNKFEYFLTNYQDLQNNIKMKCIDCGNIIEQLASSHLQGVSCKYCSRKAKRTTEEFKLEAHKIHGDLYDYSKVIYLECLTNVKIICNRCKEEFEQTPSRHLSGRGCRYCNDREINTKIFKKKAVKIHGDKYNYDKVEYIDRKTDVKIICNTCKEEFEQKAGYHLSGNGCKSCGKNVRKMTQEQFIRKAMLIHGDSYSYKLCKYINSRTGVDIICNKCTSAFPQQPKQHLYGNGCPICKESSGEKRSRQIFKELKLEYKTQVKLNPNRGYKYDGNLKYLSRNRLYEFDGKQHFEYIEFFNKTEENFQYRREIDIIKTVEALEAGYQLIRIDYTQKKNIKEHLEKALKSSDKLYVSSPEMYTWILEDERVKKLLN